MGELRSFWKMGLDGNEHPYPIEDSGSNRASWVTTEKPSIEPNLKCRCGSLRFHVCWWDYPYTGGYCRLVCGDCGNDLVLIDDHA